LPLAEERTQFEAALSSHQLFEMASEGKQHRLETSRIHVTEDPQLAARSPVLIMVVPAFAHEPILKQLAPHISNGSYIAALPARSGFEYEGQEILLRAGKNDCTLVGFQTLPWACRIRKFGYAVTIFGRKKKVGAASLPGKQIAKAAAMFSRLLGMKVEIYNSMLELSLANTGQVIHPGIMVGVLGNRAQEIFPSEDEVPLFYASVDNAAAMILSEMSNEILKIKGELEKFLPGFTLPRVVHLEKWLDGAYGEAIQDTSSLARMFQTNRGYRTLKVPVKKAQGGYRVDVTSRYLTEDVPFGLLVTKGIASILGVKTPTIDEVITQASVWTGKEYLVDGEVQGRDVARSRAPQRYKISSPEQLIL
jgi:hypothetical protein